MRRWLVCLIAGALIGCASAPEPSPWAELEVPRGTARQPLELPEWPVPTQVDGDTAIYTLDQIVQLDAFKTVSEANTAIAREHAGQIDAQTRAIGHLVKAGEAQHALTEIQHRIVEEERRHHFWEKLGLWGIVIAALAL